jgi:lysophospholipase L1-like esterase
LKHFNKHAMLFSCILGLVFSFLIGCTSSEEVTLVAEEEKEVIIEEEVIEEEEEEEEEENQGSGITNPCGYALYPPLDTLIATHDSWTRANYSTRLEVFQKDTIMPTNIVMLGNSLTEQGGNWSTKIGNGQTVNNRGIAGDNCDGALARLGEITCAQPKSVFVMIGTNDLWTNYTVEEVGSKINEIGTALADSLPNAKIFIQTLMPLGDAHDKVQRLNDINNEINGFTERTYLLIDTYTAMADDQGVLATDLTTDGVHLTSAGYEKWVAFLKLYIED